MPPISAAPISTPPSAIATGSSALRPTAPPGSNFDLTNWKVQLPVDAKGGFTGAYTEERRLETYQSAWFRTGPDGALVLQAPVEGATTGGSNYARSELRETVGDANAAWTLAQGGSMAVTMQVDRVPTLAGGAPAKVCIGQIHGGDDQLVRLYWENGTVYWVNGRNERQAQDVRYQLLDAKGRPPQVALDETFSYRMTVEDGRLTVSVLADGATYATSIKIGLGWSDNSFYFKVGLYLGTNETNSTGSGQVSIYDLDVTHGAASPTAPGGPVPPWMPTTPPVPPAPSVPMIPPVPSVPSTGTLSDKDVRATLQGTAGNDVFEVGHKKTVVHAGAGHDTVRASISWDMDPDQERLELVGTSSISGTGSRRSDVIIGSDGANFIKGDNGNDLLEGRRGADTLRGGDDDDRLNGGAGHDTLFGDDGSDLLVGGEGNDRLDGGKEADCLWGGEGADTFIFLAAGHSAPGAADRILDFATGQDRIDLSALDANAKIPGDQAFVWGGTGIGHLVLRDGHLLADVTGDGRVDLDIDLAGARLQVADVLL